MKLRNFTGAKLGRFLENEQINKLIKAARVRISTLNSQQKTL